MVVLGGFPCGSTSLEEKWSGTVPGLPDPPSTLEQIKEYFSDKLEALVVSPRPCVSFCYVCVLLYHSASHQ